MRKVLLTLEYDGTDFRGWQVQAEGRCVQGVIEEALATLLGQPTRIHGSGRTDAGVHALGQAAHFETESRRRTDLIARALNGLLARDVAVVGARDVPEDFHARYSARAKTYRYTILNRRQRSALLAGTSLHVPYPLDVDAMADALRHLRGTHDFRSFESSGGRVRDARRTISRAEIDREDDLITITVTADGFLRGMVRAIAGTLIDVGRGARTADDMPAVLAARDRSAGGPAAKPHGLCLLHVDYDLPDDALDKQPPPA